MRGVDRRLRRRERRKGGWRERAGLLATAAVALFGVAIGAAGAYGAGRGAAVRAAAFYEAPPLREHETAVERRDAHVRRLLAGELPAERLAPPPGLRPRIVLIVDDMGLDPAAFDAVMKLPGPVTMSFLPYGAHSADLAARARAAGHAVMLHLPMQPDGREDPGPNALRPGMSATALLAALEWNLDRIDGYVAVNNHMGSRATRDEALMRTVLSVLDARGVFFIDSKTGPGSRAAAAGRAVGAEVYARDVFLDPDADEDTVKTQFLQVERIARETGFAVAIAHPRAATLAAIGPWLTSAPARGFELATVVELPELQRRWRAEARFAMREPAHD